MVKYTIRKYMGDDIYSWAVFSSAQTGPGVTGCSKKEAQYHKRQFELKAAKQPKEQ
jgi:hypothetical protein